jgi:hypothetical protein
MTSPLLPFANARILWAAPGGRTSGREGLKVIAGQAYLMRVFVKRIGMQSRLNDGMGIPALDGAEYPFEGYCCAYTQLDATQAVDWKTIDVQDPGLTWDETGKLPTGIEMDSKASLDFPSAGEIEVRFVMKAGRYGAEGIGLIVSDAVGDQFFLKGGALS